ncbi:MAG: hypothetical protein ACLQU2_28010 [Candidatus Binataceae bacterium]
MRKHLKRKRRSCALCKPHKTGGAVRWKPKELAAMEAASKEISAARGACPSLS